jgi:biopolymer transport protein ExbB
MRLWDYVVQGGFIMYLLIFLNILGISTLVWRLIVIFDFRKNLSLNVEAVCNALGHLDTKAQHAVGMMKDEVSSRVHALEYGLTTVKIIASIAPLLGLLGTVLGILSAFRVIASQGLNDPSLFAEGISMALVTTVGGLIVAIPHFIGYNYLMGLLDDVEVKLEKSVISKLMEHA